VISQLWILYADVSEHSVCSIFIGGEVRRITGVRLLGYLYGKYKYPNNLIPVILPTYTASEDATDRVFRNVGIWNSDAGELPKRKNTTFRTRWKFEIKVNYYPTNKPTNHMKKSPSWDATSFSAGKKKSPYFTEPGGLWPFPQQPASCPHPGPDNAVYSVSSHFLTINLV